MRRLRAIVDPVIGNDADVRVYNPRLAHEWRSRRSAAASVMAARSPISSPKKSCGQFVSPRSGVRQVLVESLGPADPREFRGIALLVRLPFVEP
jgi:hypothetical protein